MMSQHFNSMLEHLKISGRKNSKSGISGGGGSGGVTGTHATENETSDTSVSGSDISQTQTATVEAAKAATITTTVNQVAIIGSIIDDVVDSAKMIASNNNNNNNKNTTSIVAKHVSKRHSISHHALQGNGDVRSPRELSPSPGRAGQRKLSADFRNRGGDGDTENNKPVIIRPLKIKNIQTKAETFDTLHCKAIEKVHCTRETCLGSVMTPSIIGTEARKPEQVLDHAKDFLDQYFTSIRRLKTQAHETRWQQVQKEVEASGTYQLTETELIYGAKLAWRNAYRCIGRIQWSKLQVFDCRYVTTTSGMFEAICNHIKYATNKGNLRSAITIFPQRTDGRHDYRLWNHQLISYAGYRSTDGTVIGDPLTVEFTELCMKLGWKGKGTPWDILPMVLSANGHDPEYFEYPSDLILELPLTHPQFKWFADLSLRWYAVPAVANMLFDCGGIQFTATAFSGWYMSTEIGCRNLCDINRRNLLEPIAMKMGLDTRNPASLWKDKTLVEVNIAVLHSFQSKNITIVDHHTASESFMKHLENESRLRNGCPADWVWIVPPLSSSITQVYHQEMVVYYLKPSFEYQEPPMKTHVWKKGRDSTKSKKPKRKFHFKQIARAVKFTSKLFGRALSRRIKATVLYATETGRSEQYAKQLVELLGHAFNAQVYCMSDYDISSIEHEALLLVVTSTFGNGDPPENGESFAQDLYAMKLQETGEGGTANGLKVPTSSKSFIKENSRNDSREKMLQQVRKFDRLDSLRGSITMENLADETFGPLSNVRFAVFALGSSAYPNFCAFGKYVDNLLGELGGERLIKLTTGDEMCGQEQDFRKWAPDVFKIACETFCLDPDETFSDASLALQGESLTVNTVRFTEFISGEPLDVALGKFYNRKTIIGYMKTMGSSLHVDATERFTIRIEIIANGVNYEPGDHVGIFPANQAVIVNGIINRLAGVENPDEILQLQVLKENHTSNGIVRNWEPHERLPVCSLRTLLTRYLDITTPPSRQLLTLLSTFCEDKEDKERMNLLATESSAYEDWRYWRMPHLLEVLEEFPSCTPPAPLLIAHLMPLQPRFYSISSCLEIHKNEIHLTVAIVKYRTEDGQGVEHFGVCSNYLNGLDKNDKVYLFVRSAQNFHIPKDPCRPIILVGPGTGIAPFRSFWEYWECQNIQGQKIPKVWLLFGCRNNAVDLYRDEKAIMVEKGILDRVFLALSREKNVPKTYVQDIALKEAQSIYELMVENQGHVFVCGDVTMAEHVYQTLRKIVANHEGKTEADAEKFMLSMRDENRYHEDIFGITLRTAEVHNKSRASARIRMASQP